LCYLNTNCANDVIKLGYMMIGGYFSENNQGVSYA
jgi:hypothetical protein